jgi:peptidoglycan/LPS O-acetylase OafA/YrhL
VSASFERQRSALRFVALRVARVGPAVVVGSMLTVFVAGPLLTALPLREYFASGMTWTNLDHLSILAPAPASTLPGVAEPSHVLFPVDSAAPLWTLPLLLRCYLVVLVAGMVGLLSTARGTALAVLIGGGVLLLGLHLPPLPQLPQLASGMREAADVSAAWPDGQAFWPEAFFMLGMLLYGLRRGIDINGLTALALAMVFLVFRDTAGGQPLFYLTFVYGVLWVGTTPLWRRFVPRHDYSYGIYLYGFTVQQGIASVAPQWGQALSLLVAAPLIWGCAALSWHCVERPVLMWCRGRLAHRRTLPGGGVAAGDRMVR